MNQDKHLSEESIAQAAEAMLKNQYENLPSGIKDHLKECDLCASEVVSVSDIIAIEPQQKIDNPFYKTQAFHIAIGIAATIILLFGLYYLVFNHQSKTELMANSEDSTAIIKHDNNSYIIDNDTVENNQTLKNDESSLLKSTNLYAFNSNKELEKIYNRFQNGNLRSEDVKIKTDSIILCKPKEKAHFEWKSSTTRFIIEIWNNNNVKIDEINVESQQGFTYQTTENEGLYYWKLINSDYELIYIGKLIIKQNQE